MRMKKKLIFFHPPEKSGLSVLFVRKNRRLQGVEICFLFNVSDLIEAEYIDQKSFYQ